MVRILFIAVIFFITNSCSLRKDVNVKWNLKGNYCYKDSFCKTGKLIKKTGFTLDTSKLNGATIYYDKSGNLIQWEWNSLLVNNVLKDDRKLPIFRAYYSNGKFYKFVGNSFIDIKDNSKQTTAIQMVNPPNAYKVVIIKDSFNNRLFDEYAMEPGDTDSTCYVALNNFPIKNHKYWVTYRIEDSIQILSQYSIPIEFSK
jgi:hypothetical protein